MDVIDQGVGRLFTDPDADNARAFFKTKSRALTNKVMSLKDAVAKFVHDGEYLVIGGFGANRTPIAACHEIVRQKKKNMAFAGHTATHDFQVLAAGKVFNKLDIAYIIGLEARGLSPNARRYMQSGEVEVSEWTNYSLSARLKAAAMGVSFVPTRNVMGTDTFKFSGAKIIECPFTGQKYAAMPALWPDVSFIHVHEADMYGNCRIRDITVSDLDVAKASKHLIITCERLIPNEEIRREPSMTDIAFFCVDAVCEVPYGAYPGVMAYEYFSDEEHIMEWLTVEKDPEAFKEFLDKNIYNVGSHFDYIRLHGGMEKMLALRDKELMTTGNNNKG